MTRRRIWGWVALAGGVALSLGGAALLYVGVSKAPVRPVVEIPCENVVSGCALPEMGLRVVFDQPPKSMRPFRLQVEVPAARELHVSFAMRGMQMGLNRYRLLSAGDGLWKAEVTLPVCASGRGDWLMTLDVDGRLYQLPFSSN